MTPNGKGPAWLAELGVKEGQYFTDSKLRWQRAMKARCFPPAARIFACLGLHTMAFQQEKAVKLVGGKRVPLQPIDVCQATGVDPKNFCHHMDELRRDGLAEQKGSTKGHIELYAWAVPRNTEPEKIVVSPNDNFFGSTRLHSFLNRWKIKTNGSTPSPVQLRGLEERVQKITDAELDLRNFAREIFGEEEKPVAEDEIPSRRKPDSTFGDAPINKEERNERNERNEVVVGGQSLEAEEERPTDRPTLQEFRELKELLEDEVTPVTGEGWTESQILQVLERKGTGTTEQLRKRIRAKKQLGKLTSNGLVMLLCDDCAAAPARPKPAARAAPKEETDDRERRHWREMIETAIRMDDEETLQLARRLGYGDLVDEVANGGVV